MDNENQTEPLSREAIYDEQLVPLMQKISEICGAHDIAVVACFALPTPADNNMLATHWMPFEDTSIPLPFAGFLEVLGLNWRGPDAGDVPEIVHH